MEACGRRACFLGRPARESGRVVFRVFILDREFAETDLVASRSVFRFNVVAECVRYVGPLRIAVIDVRQGNSVSVDFPFHLFEVGDEFGAGRVDKQPASRAVRLAKHSVHDIDPV